MVYYILIFEQLQFLVILGDLRLSWEADFRPQSAKFGFLST